MMSRIACAAVLLLASACGRPAAGPSPEAGRGLPPVPAERGALVVRVVYPAEGQTLGVRDSTFLFGSVGTGEAALWINNQPVEVAANGAWLAFLPVPAGGDYRLTAVRGTDTARLVRQVKVPAQAAGVPVANRLSIVPGSHMPRGAFTLEEGEPVEVRFRGTPGAAARVVLPGGAVFPLAERTARERAEGFMLDREAALSSVSEYAGSFPARALGAARGATALAPGAAGGEAVLQLIRGADTVRLPLDVSLGVLRSGAPRVGIAASDRADGQVIGTAVPGGGTPYHWFFPNGTLFTVTGARAGELRVRLTDDLSVWVDADAVRLLPLGTAAPRGSVGSVRATAHADYLDVRLATSDRLPFRVDSEESALLVTVYGAETRTNWLQYGPTDPLLKRMGWSQPADDRYQLRIDLSEPLWGFAPFYNEAGHLVVRIRRPPPIDPNHPLAALYIAVDAGHPPGGAIGPTGYTEAAANLSIAKQLIPMLRERGARVLETRPDTAAVGLGDRPLMAADSSVHLLVSVHNNAFPDGVNPWENNGTSVFYNQAQSLDLARALQHQILREFGLRDLGIARADLALVRPTWFPAVLTESMFLMIPQQEAALRDPRVQRRIAEAHLRGLEDFLLNRAEAKRQ